MRRSARLRRRAGAERVQLKRDRTMRPRLGCPGGTIRLKLDRGNKARPGTLTGTRVRSRSTGPEPGLGAALSRPRRMGPASQGQQIAGLGLAQTGSD